MNAVPLQIDSATGASVTTLAGATLAPVSGDLYLVAVANFHASVGTPTLTGTGGWAVTWTQVDTEPDAGNAQRLTLFRGVPSSGASGALTADFGGVSQSQARMIVLHCPTINQASNEGVVQHPKNTQAASSAPTATLAAFAKVYNVAILFALTNQNTTWTNSTAGWSPYTVNAGAGASLAAMMRAHATLDTGPTGTFGASGICCTIAVELAADAALLGPGDSLPASVPLIGEILVVGGRTRMLGVREMGGTKDLLAGGPGPTGYLVADPAGLLAIGAPAGSAYGYWPLKRQRDDSVGDPDPPSQVQPRYGILRDQPIPVSAGARIITLRCKAEIDDGADSRPQIIVKACSGGDDVGLVADLVITADSGTAWQTLTASFTAPRDGVVLVDRFNRQNNSRVWWDKLTLA